MSSCANPALVHKARRDRGQSLNCIDTRKKRTIPNTQHTLQHAEISHNTLHSTSVFSAPYIYVPPTASHPRQTARQMRKYIDHDQKKQRPRNEKSPSPITRIVSDVFKGIIREFASHCALVLLVANACPWTLRWGSPPVAPS